ncbi:Hypothetical protein PMT_2589 [Prochlorococcus marinus str. MIT 9313]|uniref:Uncharacterized protein n=1 Tax=Prochlorococcus marinus (strain MIT 9313) TaxID=74547 RepID=B9ER62_PROMM|nr:Hypothetical protein PMT_2589 [Prochlorococcus marinus str. MIT 9313]
MRRRLWRRPEEWGKSMASVCSGYQFSTARWLVVEPCALNKGAPLLDGGALK